MFKSVVHDFLEVVTSGGLGGPGVIVLSSAGPLLAGGGAAAAREAGVRADRLEGGGLADDARVRNGGGHNIGAGGRGGDEGLRGPGGGGSGGGSWGGLGLDGRQDRDITYIVMCWLTWTERLGRRL